MRHIQAPLLATTALLLAASASPTRAAGEATKRVSVSSAGEPGNGLSDATWLSYGAGYALFESQATNLCPATPTASAMCSCAT